jgi:hypothetical protein
VVRRAHAKCAAQRQLASAATAAATTHAATAGTTTAGSVLRVCHLGCGRVVVVRFFAAAATCALV